MPGTKADAPFITREKSLHQLVKEYGRERVQREIESWRDRSSVPEAREGAVRLLERLKQISA